jgi:hypothetical protein
VNDAAGSRDDVALGGAVGAELVEAVNEAFGSPAAENNDRAESRLEAEARHVRSVGEVMDETAHGWRYLHIVVPYWL